MPPWSLSIGTDFPQLPLGDCYLYSGIVSVSIWALTGYCWAWASWTQGQSYQTRAGQFSCGFGRLFVWLRSQSHAMICSLVLLEALCSKVASIQEINPRFMQSAHDEKVYQISLVSSRLKQWVVRLVINYPQQNSKGPEFYFLLALPVLFSQLNEWIEGINFSMSLVSFADIE